MSVAELEEQLARKIRVLQEHCRLFDETHDTGWMSEIATDVRVMVHDTKRSRSLLGQLQHLDRGSSGLQFFDTSGTGKSGVRRVRPGQTFPSGFPLSAVRLGPKWHTGVTYVAKLDDHPEATGPIPFDEWWNKSIVLLTDGQTYSRKWLTKIVANNDGGAHVDLDSRPDAYLRLIRGGETGARASVSPEGHTTVAYEIDLDVGRPVPGDEGINAVPACIRQIGHELLRTLQGPYPKLVSYDVPKGNDRTYPGEGDAPEAATARE